MLYMKNLLTIKDLFLLMNFFWKIMILFTNPFNLIFKLIDFILGFNFIPKLIKTSHCYLNYNLILQIEKVLIFNYFYFNNFLNLDYPLNLSREFKFIFDL